MKRIVTDLLAVIVLSIGSSTCLLAQRAVPADRFLERLSAHPVGDEVERDQSAEVYQALNIDSPAEVEKVLPSLVQYARGGNEVHARGYAVLFLSAIAIRADGADLLASRSEEISSLILDADPRIQNVAVTITQFVLAKEATNKRPYVSALETAIQKSKTPQDVALGMVGPLLYARFDDPGALKPVLDFLHRDDLTVDTRRELVHSLGTVPGLPEEINQFLFKELSDPDPTIRVAALVAFADSTTEYHTIGKDRVEKMANDPQENPKVRELAKQAIAGKTSLDPNVLVPNVETPPGKPKEQ